MAHIVNQIVSHIGEFVAGLAAVAFVLLMCFMALFGIQARRLTQQMEKERVRDR